MPKKKERRRHAREDSSAGRAGAPQSSVEVLEYGSDGDEALSGNDNGAAGSPSHHGVADGSGDDGGDDGTASRRCRSAAAQAAGAALARRAAAHAHAVKARSQAAPLPSTPPPPLGGGAGGSAAAAVGAFTMGLGLRPCSGGGGSLGGAGGAGGSTAAYHSSPAANRLVLAARGLNEVSHTLERKRSLHTEIGPEGERERGA
jgi:hypothetical protein